MYAGSNTEVHPLIARHHALDTDAILASVRAVREHAAESAAEMDALRTRMAQYAQASEQMSAITSSLRAHGQSISDPKRAVEEALSELDDRREGTNIVRKMLNEMGYTEGSIPERLKAVDAALKKVTRPLVPATVSAEGYYDHEMYPGPECTLTKEQSNLNAWQRTLSRADRILDYYDIPCNAIQADGTRKVLFIDERVELLVQKLQQQPEPMKAAA